jgi:hypothetical protein
MFFIFLKHLKVYLQPNLDLFKTKNMAKKQKMEVFGKEISILSNLGTEDYFSLTDLAKNFDAEKPADLIASWMKNADTLELLEGWEMMHNPLFNVGHLAEVKKDLGKNRFVISPTKWVEMTNAIGLIAKSGRYDGGTFAHKDIAMSFCFWLNPLYQLHVIQEFQRLKVVESSDWKLSREIAKINYPLHTEAVKSLIERKMEYPTAVKIIPGQIYASEADVLNVSVFGLTAEQWRAQNPDSRGNIRDSASIIELHVLANMESYNAILLRNGLNQWQRTNELTRTAAEQMKIFEETNVAAIRRLREAEAKLS